MPEAPDCRAEERFSVCFRFNFGAGGFFFRLLLSVREGLEGSKFIAGDP